jgi:ParB family chromosome partitioning protein
MSLYAHPRRRASIRRIVRKVSICCTLLVELALLLDFDMAKWWSPTAATYFNHVGKERTMAVVAEAISKEAAVPLEKMKKGAAAEAAERALVNVAWLPEPLRTK